ncbi:hypothetical protein B0H65DRAFT_157686 [Neurospora tetraspora]|uniref:Uncharacterized protein n=1 Tax=Neurospora tetraspora TaxID=94610 RepID=A0AAE0JHP5_9PEZI|nr:hypothetical protein B0H65DRAFT_157686 [Neurospora tetraspora]
MATKEERVDIHRRFRVEWEKNWWARYALSLRKRDGTLEDHAEEDLCAWQNRDWDECNRFTILERLYLMPESEREATNQLCGRVDGNVLIEHTMGVRWAESRAQKRDHKDLDTFFPTEEYRQLAKLPKFPYGCCFYSSPG